MQVNMLLLIFGAIMDMGTCPEGPVATVSKIGSGVHQRFNQGADSVKVWIYFVDKGISSTSDRQAAIDKLQIAWNGRSAMRRLRRTTAGPFNEFDLPVSNSYVQAVRATGAKVDVTSRWLNAVSATAGRNQIQQIGLSPCVQEIQLVGKGKRSMPETVREVAEPLLTTGEPERMRSNTLTLNYGASQEQLTQINAIALHEQGYTGAGVALAILDSGFYKDHEAVHPERIIAEWDFVHGDGNTQNEAGDLGNQHYHGTSVLSAAAGRKDGQIYGPAFDADLILCKTEDMSQEAPIEEDWFVGGLEFAEAHGADVVTSSLGYIDWYTQSQLDGQTAVTTKAVNIATSKGMICCNAAGNSGPPGPSLIAPADAFKVITVGAVDNTNIIGSFSSRGPTADGRVKPEVVARGVSTWLANASGPASYGYGSGTSYATPLVAGVVACLVQAHPDWPVDKIRAALFRTADYYVAHGTFDTSYARGYGLINALNALQLQFARPDFDFDGMVNAADFSHLNNCLSGPELPLNQPDCADADLDDDTDVDQADFGLLQRCLSGNTLADPACTD